MKCEIQWIDERGKLTPDDNDAVVMVRVKAHQTKGAATLKSHWAEASKWYPCCAEHWKIYQETHLENEHWESRPVHPEPTE